MRLPPNLESCRSRSSSCHAFLCCRTRDLTRSAGPRALSSPNTLRRFGVRLPRGIFCMRACCPLESCGARPQGLAEKSLVLGDRYGPGSGGPGRSQLGQAGLGLSPLDFPPSAKMRTLTCLLFFVCGVPLPRIPTKSRLVTETEARRPKAQGPRRPNPEMRKCEMENGRAPGRGSWHRTPSAQSQDTADSTDGSRNLHATESD